MGEGAPLLVDPDWLAERIGGAEVRVVDATWYLPAAGRDARAEYREAHLPGAVYLDLGTDLADVAAPVRNTLASPEALARALGAHGIGNEHHVVVYDRLGGYSAGRIWWTLRYLGHEQVSLLDGGLERWRAEGHGLTADLPTHPEATFRPRPQPGWLVSKQEVRAHLGDPCVQLVDARPEGRYAGRDAEPTPRKGHMPGAVNVPHDRQLSGDPPRLRPLEELARLYRDAGATPERRIVTTCGSGVTAAMAAFVLTLLGYPDVGVYDGSWAEWGVDPEVPVVTGSDPAAA